MNSLALLIVILRKFNFRSGSDFGGCGGVDCMPGAQEIFSFFLFFCAPPVSKVSFLGLQYEAFKCNAKNQTLGWTVYFAFPTAAIKIKENKQQITRRGVRTLYSLFALMSLLGVAAPCWTCAAAKKKNHLLFLSRNIILPPECAVGGGGHRGKVRLLGQIRHTLR